MNPVSVGLGCKNDSKGARACVCVHYYQEYSLMRLGVRQTMAMVDVSADDIVQLFTYDDAECLIDVAVWEVCCVGWACEAGRDIVHTGFTALFWTILTAGPTCTCKYE